jgi:uncharacterized protein YkwD
VASAKGERMTSTATEVRHLARWYCFSRSTRECVCRSIADAIRKNATLLQIFDNPYAPTEDILALENQVAQAINGHRGFIGKSALTFHADVSAIARVHSSDMAQNKVPLGHDGFEARIAEANRFVDGAIAAENTGMGFTSAVDVLQAWLDLADYRANIEADAPFAGIGIERVAKGPNYFTLLIL